MGFKMGSKILNFLFSTQLMLVLLILFPIAMGIGTFLESWYSTDAARIWVYNAWWFEAIMLLLMVNFMGNIKKYNLLSREKLSVLILHLSFIFILLGAFVTRYIGDEGVMPIRENNISDSYLSEKTYLTVFIDGENEGVTERKTLKSQLLLSEHVNNNFTINENFYNKNFSISFDDFRENVTEGLVLDPSGERYIKLVEAVDGNRREHYIKEGQVSSIQNILFSFNSYQKGAINITSEGGEYFIESPFDAQFTIMSTQQNGNLLKDKKQLLELRSLYQIPGFQFVFPEPALRGVFEIVDAEVTDREIEDALYLNLKYNGKNEKVVLLGGRGYVNSPKSITIDELDFHLSYGSNEVQLPFSIKLNDFIAEKYPGTENSYSSFMSRVTVEDVKTFDYDIFMNNILNHKGYRFFQASFDPDEKGTVLSVNNDFWGTFITYAGYFLLYLSMMGIFFLGNSRFKFLAKQLNKKTAVAIFLLFSSGLFGQNNNIAPKSEYIDSIITSTSYTKEHASKFGKIVIQDSGGRMKPANTFSSELLRKVSRSNSYNGLNSDQVLLSIMDNPGVWFNAPLVYIKSRQKGDSIKKIIGIDKDVKKAPLVTFFDSLGNYKLATNLEKAYLATVPTQIEKDIIELDRRVNLLYSALEGKIMRIFPIPDDANNKWVSFPEVNDVEFNNADSLYVNNVLQLYFQTLRVSRESSDYSQSEELLESIKGYQVKYGSDVMPSDLKISSEIIYNKAEIFNRLYKWYLLLGFSLLLILILQIFNDKKFYNILIKIVEYSIYLLFILNTIGLAARWYIAGHAPWSDAYESIIFVAWATVIFGIIFGRKSYFTLASATLVSSIILSVAHMNWLDPSIANLQPVLDSYWLMIHVAVIVGSYGPFAIGMILGIVVLLLTIIANKKNRKSFVKKLEELTIVNELSLTIGLVMLTIGNFLGGMWANESWGRYWGWDPKETWALISIIIYTAVLHLRIVPKLNNKWLFNLMSIISFGAIMMTYFGVNFYLVGLHSYASGDKVITPDFVYYSIGFIIILGLISYFANKKNQVL
uniref:Cytochrome c assembly protein n=1 Tax=uncultured Flavobacteriia bacterium TaxID=212695 RepID=H6RH74_9BACT|nr:cytochrome c assembly protein [uncultured Flavobacteriia bacterium]CCG00425.1 Cytochrome c assembly protein [uncultured Flavobacteriia bacterium]